MNSSGPIAWMTKNPVASNLLMLIILVAGAFGITKIDQEVFPEFELDIISVSVAYPGASPEEIEQGLVLALEEAVRGIDGIKRVSSTSAEGAGAVTAELLLDVDQEQVLSDVKASVDRIRSFPEDAEDPKITMFKQPQEVISVMVSGDVPLPTLHGLAEDLRTRILSTGSVTKVEVDGVPPREIGVEIPRETLEGLGITLDQVAMQIRAASLEVPGGEVETKGGELLVRLSDRRQSVAEYESIILRGTTAGGQVRLGDIATVVDGYADNDQRTLYDGKPAVQLSFYRVGNETPQSVADAVRAVTGEFEANLPDTVSFDYWNDQSAMLRGRIDLLVRNGRMGLILVVGILAMFLNARLAFWVAMGIPISFLGSFLLMPSLDITINMISLFSLIVTLGMVVDDAIVVGEAAYTKMEEGQDRLTAAISGAKEMAMPVTFAILTTIAAFSPMFFVPGFMGKLFKIMPAVIVSVLLFSLIESFFVLPAHLANLKEHSLKNWWSRMLNAIENFLDRPRKKVSAKLHHFINVQYGPFLQKTLGNRYTAVATAVAILLVAVGLVGGRIVPTSFMPNIEGFLVATSVRLPYGAPSENTEAVREILEASLAETIEKMGAETVRGVYTTVGSPPVPQGGPAPKNQISGSHMLGIQVYLVESNERDYSSSDFAKAWETATPTIAGLEAISFSGEFGPQAGKAVDLRLTHPDANVLYKAAEDAQERLRSYSDLTQVESTLAAGKPRLDYQMLPEAQTLGVTAQDVGAQLRSSFYGSEALREQSGREEIKVMVRLPKDQRTSEYDIHALRVRTPTGQSVHLSDVAKFERSRAPTSIQREGGKRTVNVQASRAAHAETAQNVLASLNEVDIPELVKTYPGLEIGFSGEQREQAESFSSLGKNYLIAMLGIYALLAIPFRSYLQPLIIMSVIPFGIVGAIFGHLVMGFNLNIISMFGIVALSGVVVNDSLVLIDAANVFRRKGHSPIEAVFMAGKRRFRPILLTSLTTFFGLAPMIFETSLQARFLIPMAISLGFGVLFATGIVLLLVPAIYMIVEDIRSRFVPEPEAIDADKMEPIQV